jgi:hypothetical protein
MCSAETRCSAAAMRGSASMLAPPPGTEIFESVCAPAKRTAAQKLNTRHTVSSSKRVFLEPEIM